MKDDLPNRNKRIIFILSGATDACIGGVILLIGFGFLPVDVADFGLPSWIVILIGAFIFIIGAWMAAYHYSRLDE